MVGGIAALSAVAGKLLRSRQGVETDLSARHDCFRQGAALARLMYGLGASVLYGYGSTWILPAGLETLSRSAPSGMTGA
jgi:hypothetical protein